MFGVNKLWAYLRDNYPSYKVSKRDVGDFLKHQENYQINKQVRNKKSTKPVVAEKIGYIQIDLVDFSKYKEKQFSWIFTAIDIFSRKANAIPLSKKSASSVVRALPKLLSAFSSVSVIQSDNGNEFLNVDFKNYCEVNGIKHIRSKEYTPQSQGKVERFNGTLKRLIIQNMSVNDNFLWVQELPKLLDNYNNTVNRITKINPNDVEGNEEKVISNNSKAQIRNVEVERFRVGDRVRVALKKGKLDKKSVNNFTKEIYTVYKVIKSKKDFILESYKLIDSENDLIRGVYNSTELVYVPE